MCLGGGSEPSVDTTGPLGRSARETSPLAQWMQDIIDIDTGAVISSGSTIEEMGDALLERLVEVASGQLRTKAELLGQDDFIP